MNPQALSAMPAFPTNETLCSTPQPGMDLRTYIAAQVYAQLIGSDKLGNRSMESVAAESVLRADKLIEVLCNPVKSHKGESYGSRQR